MPATCHTCGAYRPTAVCPVCQQFDPPLKRSALAGAALIGFLTAGLAVAGWAGAVCWKWDRWRGLFGDTAEPPVQADARLTAGIIGLLLFAVVGPLATAAVVRSTPPE